MVDTVVPIAGVVLVLGTVLFVIQLRLQVGLAVLGLLLVQVGVWRMGRKILPQERKYFALREEADRMILLVRELNGAALRLKADSASPAVQSEFDQVLARMHDSIVRMSDVAGKTDAELEAEGRLQPSEQ